MNDVTVGIDIGTTSVKAVAADDDGNVLSRARIPHRVVAPDPGRFEHDPQQAWIDGVLAAWNDVSAGAAGRSVAAVTISAMVPSMCGVDSAGMPVTPGLLYGDARGRTPRRPLERWGRFRWRVGPWWAGPRLRPRNRCQRGVDRGGRGRIRSLAGRS